MKDKLLLCLTIFLIVPIQSMDDNDIKSHVSMSDVTSDRKEKRRSVSAPELFSKDSVELARKATNIVRGNRGIEDVNFQKFIAERLEQVKAQKAREIVDAEIDLEAATPRRSLMQLRSQSLDHLAVIPEQVLMEDPYQRDAMIQWMFEEFMDAREQERKLRKSANRWKNINGLFATGATIVATILTFVVSLKTIQCANGGDTDNSIPGNFTI